MPIRSWDVLAGLRGTSVLADSGALVLADSDADVLKLTLRCTC